MARQLKDPDCPDLALLPRPSPWAEADDPLVLEDPSWKFEGPDGPDDMLVVEEDPDPVPRLPVEPPATELEGLAREAWRELIRGGAAGRFKSRQLAGVAFELAAAFLAERQSRRG